MSRHGKPCVYVFIGPEKTGTTTIFDLLPFSQVPTQKEMFLLSRRHDEVAEVARIETQIAEQGTAFIVEPTYFISVFARETLAKLADRYDIKIVHTRRDPVERMVSHYLHHKAKGRVSEPEAAVAAYPEIVKASRYEPYAALWQAAIPAFFVINLGSGTNLADALGEIGIVPRRGNEAMRSNQRLAPRSASLASLASTLWQGFIGLGLNRLVPSRLKNWLKNLVYYGGDLVEASEEERACLIRLLSITD
jgi:hypothetical protein